MRADTRTVSIEAPTAKVFRFVADPRNLPRWAVGFARSVREEAGRWYVATGEGEVGLRVVADESSGVVDFHLSPAPGVEALAASRVVPRGTGAEYTFTQFQGEGVRDELFRKSVRAVEHELTVLKAIVEVECPP